MTSNSANLAMLKLHLVSDSVKSVLTIVETVQSISTLLGLVMVINFIRLIILGRKL